MKPTRLFKGPLFTNRTLPTRSLTDLPAARGNIDEDDFECSAYQRARLASGRRTGKTFEAIGIPSTWALGDKENKKDE